MAPPHLSCSWCWWVQHNFQPSLLGPPQHPPTPVAAAASIYYLYGWGKVMNKVSSCLWRTHITNMTHVSNWTFWIKILCSQIKIHSIYGDGREQLKCYMPNNQILSKDLDHMKELTSAKKTFPVPSLLPEANYFDLLLPLEVKSINFITLAKKP